MRRMASDQDLEIYQEFDLLNSVTFFIFSMDVDIVI